MRHSENTLPTLDFLRAVAVLLVLADHLLLILKFDGIAVFRLGRLGVLLFFIHTSYVLMLSLERMYEQSESGLWTRFMVRRCFRIYPLSIAALAALLVFHVPQPIGRLTSLMSPTRSGLEWLSNFTLTMNFVRARPLLTPLWTLPYELTMYLFLPALFLLAYRSRSTRQLGGMWMAAVIVAVVLARLPSAGQLDFLVYAPFFLAGILAYRITKSNPPQLPFRVLPLALTFAIIVFWRSTPHGANLLACLVTLGVALVLPHVQQPDGSFLRAAAHHVAKYSYGIYIAHVFCLWIAFYVVRGPWPLQVAVFLATLAIIPAALYHTVEAPMIRCGRRLTEPSRERPAKTVAAEA
jgi:peptidoglycan/LPS O-acetylase OafA/YrhL